MISSPSSTRQDNKIFPRGVGVSISGTPLLAEASLRGVRLSGTSLSGMLMLADASLGGTWGLADASLRGALLGDTLLLAEAWLCGFSLSGSLLLVDSLVIWPYRTHPGPLRGVTGAFCCFSTLPLLRLLLKFPEATTMLPVITKPVAKHHGAPIAPLSLL
jgi:hypothetical protein